MYLCILLYCFLGFWHHRLFDSRLVWIRVEDLFFVEWLIGFWIPSNGLVTQNCSTWFSISSASTFLIISLTSICLWALVSLSMVRSSSSTNTKHANQISNSSNASFIWHSLATQSYRLTSTFSAWSASYLSFSGLTHPLTDTITLLFWRTSQTSHPCHRPWSGSCNPCHCLQCRCRSRASVVSCLYKNKITSWDFPKNLSTQRSPSQMYCSPLSTVSSSCHHHPLLLS